jgi:hypothetical protein
MNYRLFSNTAEILIFLDMVRVSSAFGSISIYSPFLSCLSFRWTQFRGVVIKPCNRRHEVF